MWKRAATLGAGFALAASIAVPVEAVVIFSDNFESYLNTAQMEAAGAWGDNGSSNSPGTLSTSGGNPGKFMNHQPIDATATGAISAQHNIAPTTPTNTSPIIWSFDFFDDGNAGGKRVSGGLRNSANSNNILEMGRFNNAHDPVTGINPNKYAVRTILNLSAASSTPHGNSGWVTFEGDPAVQTGWHTFTATILADYILYELDLGANGGVDFRRIITTSGGPGKVYNVLRLGGPSGNGSAAGGAGFDNVSISTFEPIKGIFSTGIGNDSTNLDPHWTVQRPASATSPVAMTLGLPTFEVPNDGFPIPPWAANTASSQWISAAPNHDGSDTPGFYDYSIDFVLAPGETNYRILGNWAADDFGANIFLNGVGTGQTAPGFGGLVPFTVESGFLAGNNRLTFRVQNAGTAANPTGVRVDFSSFGVIVIPEPATLALGTFGAFALLGGRRRRSND